jgi:hypothetical protein
VGKYSSGWRLTWIKRARMRTLKVCISSPSKLCANVGDDGHRVQVREGQAQIEVDLEYAVLAVSEQDEPGRVVPRDLATELAADRAASPGDEDLRAVEDGGQGLVLGLDHFPV